MPLLARIAKTTARAETRTAHSRGLLHDVARDVRLREVVEAGPEVEQDAERQDVESDLVGGGGYGGEAFVLGAAGEELLSGLMVVPHSVQKRSSGVFPRVLQMAMRRLRVRL